MGGIAPQGLSPAFRAHCGSALWRSNAGCFSGLGYLVSRFGDRGIAGCGFYRPSVPSERLYRGSCGFGSGGRGLAHPPALGRQPASRGLIGESRGAPRRRIAQNNLSDTPLCAVTGSGVGQPPRATTPSSASQNLAASGAEVFRLPHSLKPQRVGAILYAVCLTVQAQNFQLLGLDRACASFLCGGVF